MAGLVPAIHVFVPGRPEDVDARHEAGHDDVGQYRMTATPETQPTATRASFADAFAVYLRPRVLIVLLLGFSSGLPLALSGSTLLVWMTESGVNLGTIGLFALVGTPYTLKFLWAPVADAIDVPYLSRWLGRRRGWLVFSQLLLMAAIVFLALGDPRAAPFTIALGAMLVATASATQDIVVDAFRVESLPEREQAAGMAGYVAAYRIGMLVSTAGALFLVSYFEQSVGVSKSTAWMWGYLAMGLLVLIGTAAALIATEPERSAVALAAHKGQDALTRVAKAAIGALSEFLSYRLALVALAFVVLFKFTDALSGTMTAPFVIDLGFSRNEYAAIIKGVGLAALLLGGFAGGFVARAYPLATSLWIGGILQALANLAFSWQAVVGVDAAWLTFAITVENFTSAIGTVIFVAYLSALCRNPLHTATQYALLTALAAVGRTYLSSGAGFIAAATGWGWFFVICALAGIPSLVLLWWLQKSGHFERLERPSSPSP
jgi:PAT family beta-lactamase induction signal transducer AmpG